MGADQLGDGEDRSGGAPIASAPPPAGGGVPPHPHAPGHSNNDLANKSKLVAFGFVWVFGGLMLVGISKEEGHEGGEFGLLVLFSFLLAVFTLVAICIGEKHGGALQYWCFFALSLIVLWVALCKQRTPSENPEPLAGVFSEFKEGKYEIRYKHFASGYTRTEMSRPAHVFSDPTARVQMWRTPEGQKLPWHLDHTLRPYGNDRKLSQYDLLPAGRDKKPVLLFQRSSPGETHQVVFNRTTIETHFSILDVEGRALAIALPEEDNCHLTHVCLTIAALDALDTPLFHVGEQWPGANEAYFTPRVSPGQWPSVSPFANLLRDVMGKHNFWTSMALLSKVHFMPPRQQWPEEVDHWYNTLIAFAVLTVIAGLLMLLRLGMSEKGKNSAGANGEKERLMAGNVTSEGTPYYGTGDGAPQRRTPPPVYDPAGWFGGASVNVAGGDFGAAPLSQQQQYQQPHQALPPQYQQPPAAEGEGNA